jgi:hypothetical protein
MEGILNPVASLILLLTLYFASSIASKHSLHADPTPISDSYCPLSSQESEKHYSSHLHLGFGLSMRVPLERILTHLKECVGSIIPILSNQIIGLFSGITSITVAVRFPLGFVPNTAS